MSKPPNLAVTFSLLPCVFLALITNFYSLTPLGRYANPHVSRADPCIDTSPRRNFKKQVITKLQVLGMPENGAALITVMQIPIKSNCISQGSQLGGLHFDLEHHGKHPA